MDPPGWHLDQRGCFLGALFHGSAVVEMITKIISHFSKNFTIFLAICFPAVIFLYGQSPRCTESTTLTVNVRPIANAGLDRFAMRNPVVLDGSSSYDPDHSGSLTYDWRQLSGPLVTISNSTTSQPTISGFSQTLPMTYPAVVIQLLVGDGKLKSKPDRVVITLLPDRSYSTLDLENPPFDPNRPTIVFFGGGDGTDGGMSTSSLEGEWARRANIINFPEYSAGIGFSPGEPLYLNCAELLLAFLSSVAPAYDQPIQLIGFSTGARPATAVGDYINTWDIFCLHDARYNTNRITLLDGFLPDLENLDSYQRDSIIDEPCEIDSYGVIFQHFYPGAINVSFQKAFHNTPHIWFANSISPSAWANEDMFAHGLTGGAYISVVGPGKNLRMKKDASQYHFKWVGTMPDTFSYFDKVAAPGLLPQAVSLIGPRNGSKINPKGAVFSCRPCENVIGYRLLFGPDQDHLKDVVSDTTKPPKKRVSVIPYTQTYWAIEARDRFGTTMTSDPRLICAK